MFQIYPQQFPRDPGIIRAHFGVEDPYIGGKPPAFARDDLPTIIPRRKRSSVTESWRRRGMDMDVLDKSWREMEEFIKEHDPYLLDIEDRAHRTQQLLEIERLIGKDLDVDFSRMVGHKA